MNYTTLTPESKAGFTRAHFY